MSAVMCSCVCKFVFEYIGAVYMCERVKSCVHVNNVQMTFDQIQNLKEAAACDIPNDVLRDVLMYHTK